MGTFIESGRKTELTNKEDNTVAVHQVNHHVLTFTDDGHKIPVER